MLDSSESDDYNCDDYFQHFEFKESPTDSSISSYSCFSSSSISVAEEFVRRLFTACDRDEDGFLNRDDLEEVCRQLNLDGDVSEVMEQLGVRDDGKISYEDFAKCKSQLMSGLNQGHTSSSESNSVVDPSSVDHDKRYGNNMDVKLARMHDSIPLSELPLQMPDLPLLHGESAASTSKVGRGFPVDIDSQTLQQLQHLRVVGDAQNVPSSSRTDIQATARSTDFLEIANRLHLAALTSLKNEIYDVNSKLNQVSHERDNLKIQVNQLMAEKQKLQRDYEERLASQFMRVTELQSVIAELTRKLNEATGNKIPEEDEGSQSTSDLEAEEGFSNRSEGSHACTECSCDNCDSHLENAGPNQVNFLATTKVAPEEINDASSSVKETEIDQSPSSPNKRIESGSRYDLHAELSRVIGALECTVADRKKIGDGKEIVEDNKGASPTARMDQLVEQTEKTLENVKLINSDYQNKSPERTLKDLTHKIHILEKQKDSLEKKLQQYSVEEYVNRKTSDTALEEEISTLHKERDLFKGRLEKAEQELEDLRASNSSIRDEREKLRRRTRSLQDALDRKSFTSVPSPMPSPVPESPSPTLGSSNARSKSFSGSNNLGTQSPIASRKMSLQTQSSSSTFHSSASSPFAPVPPKYPVSPFSSLPRQGVKSSSDLGSSVGDEGAVSELSKALVRCLHNRIPETLLQTLLMYRQLDQVFLALVSHFESEVNDTTRELNLEIEKLTSKLSHLKSQNDLLQLCLEESKGNCERSSILVGKYESNNMALSLALQNMDELIEAYEALLQLQEAESSLMLANFQATSSSGNCNTDTLKSLTSTHSSRSNASMASSQTSNSHYQIAYGEDYFQEDEDLYRQSQKRRDAEAHAKLLLHKLDKKYESFYPGQTSGVGVVTSSELDELSYKSRTSTGSSQNSSSNVDTLTKEEESRLRDYIQVLKTERHTVESTVMELESIHDVVKPVEPLGTEVTKQDRNLDIETVVIFQEMQALKEERAELKHRIYLLEKEKKALELKLGSREAQEQAYIVHIEHLKSEVREQIRKRKQLLKDGKNLRGMIQEDEERSGTSSGNGTPCTTLEQLKSSEEDIPADLYEAARREKKLKVRIQELVETLEKLSKNSEIRHSQTAEYINDLKRANGALVAAYEKAKKKHASRLKKFEVQLINMAEKHQEQVRILKERISLLEEDRNSRNETSL